MAKDLEVAILFADVVGSTQLYDKFGDTKASETVARCLDVMKESTYQFNGTVIKTIGDEVMSTFPTVDEAMSAASLMHKGLSADLEEDGIPVSIRVGCHFGPVVQEQNDIFGAAVHTANRMTSQAKAKQIIISGTTVEQMGPEWRAQTRQIDVATVRGKIDEVALFDQGSGQAEAGGGVGALIAQRAAEGGCGFGRALRTELEQAQVVMRAGRKGCRVDGRLETLSRLRRRARPGQLDAEADQAVDVAAVDGQRGPVEVDRLGATPGFDCQAGKKVSGGEISRSELASRLQQVARRFRAPSVTLQLAELDEYRCVVRIDRLGAAIEVEGFVGPPEAALEIRQGCEKGRVLGVERQ